MLHLLPVPRSTRRILLLTHRYGGLLLAPFLILLGVTGSLLAFNTELERLITPKLFAAPHQGATALSLADLAERAEALAPDARLDYVQIYSGRVLARMSPRKNATTGLVSAIGFDQLFLDPFTGTELGRRLNGDPSQGLVNLMPFVYRLHRELALGQTGVLIFGLLALLWTIDCIVALYLTFPATFAHFWRRWKRSWWVKWPAGMFRLNFDVHRAGGLWLWIALLAFAWSSVMFNLPGVYDAVTAKAFDYLSPDDVIASSPPHPENTPPKIGWQHAARVGASLLQKEAARVGFTLGEPKVFAYISSLGVYSYGASSDRDVRGRMSETAVWFDGDTGELRKLWLPTGERLGNTLSTWLYALHFADVADFLPYRAFVCLLGLLIAVLSGTGIYIWLRKYRARLASPPPKTS